MAFPFLDPGALLSDWVLWSLLVTVVGLLLMVGVFGVFTLVLRIRNDQSAARWERLESVWEPLLLEALADGERLPDLWASVGHGDRLHFLELVLRYAQRVTGMELDTLKRAADPYLELVVPRLASKSVGIRSRAVQTLGTLGLPGYRAQVSQAMRDPSPFVAIIAARHLAQEVGGRVAGEILRNLDHFKAFRLEYLVDTVASMGPSAIPAIRKTLLDRTADPRTRVVAAQSLASLRDLGSAGLAEELARKEENPEMVAALLRLLSEVGTSDHLEAIRRHLDSPRFYIRAAAVRALSRLGDEGEIPLLLEKLTDPSAWVALAAARGIYVLGGRELLLRFVGSGDTAKLLFQQVLAEDTPS